MRKLLLATCCALLAGCAGYVPAEEATVPKLSYRESMRYYRPLPRPERLVSSCDMDVTTKVVTCR